MRLKRAPTYKHDAALHGYHLLNDHSTNQNINILDDVDDHDEATNHVTNNIMTNKQFFAQQQQQQHHHRDATNRVIDSNQKQNHSHDDDNEDDSDHNDDGSINDGESSALETTLLEEIRIIVVLSGQGIIAQLAWSGQSFLVASYIGRNYGSIHLDGYMLAMLSCNLTAYSLMEGIFSALDTLLPQSYGNKNYSEVQLLSIRCIIISVATIMPFIIMLAIYMDQILLFFGEDPVASQYATNWFRIYCCSVPFYILYHTTNSFLSAQYIVLPEVITSLVSSICILPILITLCGTLFGYLGTSISIVIYQAIQACMMIGYVIWQQPHHPDTWPRPIDPNNKLGHFQSIIQKSIKWKPFSKLLFLGIGGMLAESEWIYWEILSLMVGTLGLHQLSVHAISTQILTITFMIPLGMCEAVEIRVANVLPQSSYHAKILSFYYSICSTILIATISYFVYIFRFGIYRIFTNELEVINGCEQIWMEVCFFIFNTGILEVNAGIATALGMQWTMGFFTVVFLWCTSLPALYYYAIYQHGGLKMAWSCILPFYVMLNIAIILRLVFCDWEAIAADVRKDRNPILKMDYEPIDISVSTASDDDHDNSNTDDNHGSHHDFDEEEAKDSLAKTNGVSSNTNIIEENGTYGSVLKLQHTKQC